jgi:hypothetical protein
VKLNYLLWAFFSALANNHVLAEPSKPLAFRRGRDENRLIHCQYDKPGWATYETPTGERTTELLADGDVGQLVVAYGDATGTRIEFPAVMADAAAQGAEHAASAAAGFGHP